MIVIEGNERGTGMKGLREQLVCLFLPSVSSFYTADISSLGRGENHEKVISEQKA